MAWTTLPSYSDGNALTAAQMNAIRANINETAVARAANAAGYFVATGVNAVVERLIDANSITTTNTTTSTAYNNLDTGSVGPECDRPTGIAALVFTTAQLENSTGAGAVWASFEVSGATTTAASDTRAIMEEKAVNVGTRAGVTTYITVTPGTNVFTMKYRVTSGTGSFDDRRMTLMPL